MADKQDPRSTLSPDANQEREVREVATKFKNLRPAAQAEVVNKVLAKGVSKQLSGFSNFMREQGVVGVGIGLVFGIQIKAVVDTVMASFVNPITQLILPGGRLSAQKSTINWGSKSADIGWGAIVYSMFTFVIVALIIYAAYKFLKLDKFSKKDK